MRAVVTPGRLEPRAAEERERARRMRSWAEIPTVDQWTKIPDVAVPTDPDR
jgi:hypothetical protein